MPKDNAPGLQRWGKTHVTYMYRKPKHTSAQADIYLLTRHYLTASLTVTHREIWKEHALHCTSLRSLGFTPFCTVSPLEDKTDSLQWRTRRSCSSPLLPFHPTLMKCQAGLASALFHTQSSTPLGTEQALPWVRGLLNHSVYKVRMDETTGVYPFLSTLLHSFCFSSFPEPAPSSSLGMHL